VYRSQCDEVAIGGRGTLDALVSGGLDANTVLLARLETTQAEVALGVRLGLITGKLARERNGNGNVN
jgi:hypothetical protein